MLIGIGTIDRLKKRKGQEVTPRPAAFSDVFGTSYSVLWLVPVDPVFDDEGRVLNYRRGGRWTRAVDES